MCRSLDFPQIPNKINAWLFAFAVFGLLHALIEEDLLFTIFQLIEIAECFLNFAAYYHIKWKFDAKMNEFRYSENPMIRLRFGKSQNESEKSLKNETIDDPTTIPPHFTNKQ